MTALAGAYIASADSRRPCVPSDGLCGEELRAHGLRGEGEQANMARDAGLLSNFQTYPSPSKHEQDASFADATKLSRWEASVLANATGFEGWASRHVSPSPASAQTRNLAYDLRKSGAYSPPRVQELMPTKSIFSIKGIPMEDPEVVPGIGRESKLSSFFGAAVRPTLVLYR